MSEPPAKRRRVPQEQRKRSERSCDQCRKRRGKCEPSPDSSQCVACQISRTSCTYNSPRKTRFQGSVSDLSDRYRCLDAIVRAAFPDEAATSVPELLRLGAKHGFQMPNLSNVELPADVLFASEQSAQNHDEPASEQLVSAETPVVQTTDDAVPALSTQDDRSPGLVRDSSGQAHHIGPTGSLAFFASLRNLISSRFKCGGGGRPASFAHDSAAKTLEGAEDMVESSGIDATSPDSLSTIDRASGQPDMAEEEKRLPSTPQMNELIQSYFDHVHLDLPLFHRASFEEEYECYVLGPRAGKRQEANYIAPPDSGWGWLACLHLILVFGSLTSPGSQNPTEKEFRRQSVAFVRSHLSIISTKSSLWNVRCMALLSLYLHNNSERNAAYLVAGTAMRCSLALGLHRRDLDGSFRPIEREMRKRTFCSLYAYEQFLCSTLGRPSGMGDPDIELTAPKEGFLYNGNTVAELTAASVELQRMLFKTRWATMDQAALLESLRSWKAQLPDFLDIPRCVSPQDVSVRANSKALEPSTEALRMILAHQPPPRVRSILLLHIQYHYIAALITRAALLHSVASSYNGHDVPVSPTLNQTSTKTAEACVYHAAQISSLITLLRRFNLLMGESALDIFYGYSAGMVLVLRLLQTSQSGLSQRGQQVRRYLTKTVDGLRNAIRSTTKSPTMSRFAAVLESFAILQTSTETSRAGSVENETIHSQDVQPPAIPVASANGAEQTVLGDSDFTETNLEVTPPYNVFSNTLGEDLSALYGTEASGIFDELPQLPCDFAWSTFENSMEFGWADFEGLLRGNSHLLL